MHRKDFAPEAPGQVVRVEGEYWAFIPNRLPPQLAVDWSLAGLASDAHAALGELAGLMRAMANPHILYAPFTRREAVLSSRIEGTQASLQDLLLHEAGDRRPAQHRDVREVANYVAALEHGLRRSKALPVSSRLMREMHARLFDGRDGARAKPGEFRQSQNWIGRPGSALAEASYVPPPSAELAPALADFERYLHEESDLPSLVRLALIHYQLEAIHPFVDGNGRIGRLLIMLLLVDWGLLPGPAIVLSAHFERSRPEYYDRLLAVSQRGDWSGWLQYFLGGITDESRDAIRRSRALIGLRDDYRELVMEDTRAPGTALRLVDRLFDVPALSIPSTARDLELTQRSVQLQVARLVKLDILHEATGRQRDRVFVAQGIADALTEES